MTLMLISSTMVTMEILLDATISSVALNYALLVGFSVGALLAGSCINKLGRIEKQLIILCLLIAALVSILP